jgi:NTP pyrophosphatase (non-canonical NTP hydrolase)
MKVIDNISELFGDDLKQSLEPNIKLKVAASCFSIYAFEALKDERDWDQFHNPKNLAMALSVEVSELVEIFQWLTAKQSEAIMQGDEATHVEEEMADILIYLLRIADKLNIDLDSAVSAKIIKNSKKYPL